MQIFGKDHGGFCAAQSGAVILRAHDPFRARLMRFGIAVVLYEQNNRVGVMINRFQRCLDRFF